MIGKLTGTLSDTTPDGVAILDVGGVGYAVRVPFSLLGTMRVSAGAQKNKPVALFIYTAVREDAIDLYGFLTQEELVFFKQLMSVSGIGPKSALGVLNAADVPTLKRSIAKGDATILTKVFGIGKKSAERIVVELRDKLASDSSTSSPAEGGASGSDVEVVEALIALGYSAAESRRALKESSRQVPDSAGVRERLALALKTLGAGVV